MGAVRDAVRPSGWHPAPGDPEMEPRENDKGIKDNGTGWKRWLEKIEFRFEVLAIS